MASKDRQALSADDMALAADWLREYNNGAPSDDTASMLRVAAWLDSERLKREARAAARVDRQIDAGLRSRNLPVTDASRARVRAVLANKAATV